MTAWVPRGRTRGRLPGMPPPVMCAMAGNPSLGHDILEHGPVAAVRHAAVRRRSYCRFRRRKYPGRARRLRRPACGRANIHWCAGRAKASASRTSPARTRAVFRMRLRSTTPTINPARSYSPGGVGIRQLGGFAADQSAAGLHGRRGSCRRRSARRRRGPCWPIAR